MATKSINAFIYSMQGGYYNSNTHLISNVKKMLNQR